RVAGEDLGHGRVDPRVALGRRAAAAGLAYRHPGPHQPVLARVHQVHVERAFGVAAHAGALAPVRHRHVAAGAVAVVVVVVHLGDGADVGAFLQVGVEVHPQVRVALVVDVAARLQVRACGLADAVAGGGGIAARL